MNHKYILPRRLLALRQPMHQCCRAFGVKSKRSVDNIVMLAGDFNRTLSIVEISVQLRLHTRAVRIVQLLNAIFTAD